MATKHVEHSPQLHLRLPDELQESFDAYVEEIEKLTRAPYLRTTAAISLIARGLEAVKAEKGKKS